MKKLVLVATIFLGIAITTNVPQADADADTVQYGVVTVGSDYQATAFRMDSDGDGYYLLAIVITPLGTSTYIYPGGITVAVEQGGREYAPLLFDLLDRQYPLSGFSGYIYTEKRLLVSQHPENTRFNDQDHLTLVFNPLHNNTQRFEIPSAPGYHAQELPSYNFTTQTLRIPHVEVGSDYFAADMYYDGNVFQLTTLTPTTAP